MTHDEMVNRIKLLESFILNTFGYGEQPNNNFDEESYGEIFNRDVVKYDGKSSRWIVTR